jgi:hypothetical protein
VLHDIQPDEIVHDRSLYRDKGDNSDAMEHDLRSPREVPGAVTRQRSGVILRDEWNSIQDDDVLPLDETTQISESTSSAHEMLVDDNEIQFKALESTKEPQLQTPVQESNTSVMNIPASDCPTVQ